MFELNKYLQSGIIEAYCLGLASANESAQLLEYTQQYPELKQALALAEQDLEQYLWRYAQTAPKDGLAKVLKGIGASTIEEVELSKSDARLEKFIPISEHSDYQQWQRLTQDLPTPRDIDLHLHELYRDDHNGLYVVWIKNSIPNEEHSEVLESILCLEGHCIGKLANEEIELRPGSFWAVPLNTVHSLEVVSNTPAKLILMYRKVV